jgi:hypothetical protein
VLLKNNAKQEARHSEPLAGEESAHFSPAAGRLPRRSFNESGSYIPVYLYPCIPVYLFQKQTQFFHDQICVINIKNAEMEAQKLGKKTKQTHLWITFYVAHSIWDCIWDSIVYN